MGGGTFDTIPFVVAGSNDITPAIDEIPLLPMEPRGRVFSPVSRLMALRCLYSVMYGVLSVYHAANNAREGKKDTEGVPGVSRHQETSAQKQKLRGERGFI